ncbi:LOW QUALITY PROTEIN: tRNA nucleotidyltransferase [Bacillus sp. JCM 19046]|nr:LOW QUALITY PROTEIN: tRNA nucleotidyltransferase [Bacillus sp. JCM 19046]
MDDAIACIKQLNEAGHEAYLVGGAVRDFLLKRPIHDYDLTTSATTDEIKACFGKSVQVNKAHQTVLVRHNGSLFEITPFKGDTLEADLKNRDFTINSLAMDVHYRVIDVSGGLQDLEAKQLCSIDPNEAFQQDPLRMLRAARFVSVLGFNPNQNLLTSIKSLSHLLRSVAKERITHETEQLILGMHSNEAFLLLKKTGLLDEISAKCHQTKRFGSFLPRETWTEKDRAWLELAVSIQSIDFLASFSLANQLKKKVKRAYAFYEKRQSHGWTNMMLYKAGLEIAILIEQVRKSRGLMVWTKQELDSHYARLPIHAKSELALSGHDLLQIMKRPAGPWVNEALLSLEQAVVSGNVNNEKEELLSFLKKGTS